MILFPRMGERQTGGLLDAWRRLFLTARDGGNAGNAGAVFSAPSPHPSPIKGEGDGVFFQAAESRSAFESPPPVYRDATALNASAVASSAGKNDSMASSDSVTSTGVPNIVVVPKNDSTPCGVANCSGTTMLAYS